MVVKSNCFKSPFLVAHISDAVRLALLYKYGGIYSDLDTITIKSFESLLNYSGFGFITENGKSSLGNGIIIFKSSHPYLEFAMNHFSKNYNPYVWGLNGPTLIIETLKLYCNQNQDIFDKIDHTGDFVLRKFQNSKFADIKIFPEAYFYPFNYKNEYEILFDKMAPLNITKIKDTYSVHYYGSLSKNFTIKPSDNSLFKYLAWSNCRETYDFVDRSNSSFE